MSVELKLNEQGTVTYTATAVGGVNADITAVSADPETVRVDSNANGEIIHERQEPQNNEQ